MIAVRIREIMRRDLYSFAMNLQNERIAEDGLFVGDSI